ncbi:MAG TPA: N-formylglutamate amidohydrolase [Gemmatimonadales bacterium]
MLVTCEHAGHRVPRAYAPLFRTAEAKRALESHRGYDIGARSLARRLARALDADLVDTTVSRLVIDLNRSRHHRHLFSEFTRTLDRDARERIVELYYRPPRRRIEAAIGALVAQSQRVVHIGVHTFTPVLHGARRRADAALLYDPARRAERSCSRDLRAALRRLMPALLIRFNYPYRGAADGLTTALRRQFPPSAYLGIELEVNQRHLTPNAATRATVMRAVVEGFRRWHDDRR